LSRRKQAYSGYILVCLFLSLCIAYPWPMHAARIHNIFEIKYNIYVRQIFYLNRIIFDETYIYAIIHYAPGESFEYISIC
jgi:hypothetical protein